MATGRFGSKVRYWELTRVSYCWHIGLLNPGDLVCHRCDVQICVNPRDLFPGSHLVNNQDRSMKGRSARAMGSDNPNSVLSWMERLEIWRRWRSGRVTQEQLARQYDVSSSTINEEIKAWVEGRRQ